MLKNKNIPIRIAQANFSLVTQHNIHFIGQANL